jgi:hypothetical protein
MSEEEASKEQNTANEPEKSSGSNEIPQAVPAQGSSNTSLLIMVVCIVGAALGLIFFMKSDGGEGPGGTTNGADAGAASGTLVSGKEYMIYIRNIEVQSRKANGKAWDSGDTAPDIFYTLSWKKNKIYESDKKSDSLIAEWIPVGVSLKDSIMSGKVSVDQAISLPIVKFDKEVQESDELLFNIIDSDVLSNDGIEDLRVYLSKLKEGDNVFDFKGKPGHGLIKAVIRVINNDLSTDEKIQALMRGQ